MAATGVDKMDDLEDGEISGSSSESETGVTDRERAKVQTAPAFTGTSFQCRAPPAPSITSYRSAAGPDSSGSGSDSEEEATLWRRKRQKCSNATPVVPQALPAAAAPHKVNNIWGAVVQDQCQEAVATELGILGMEGGISMSSRQSETYNYVLARKLIEKERQELEQQEAAAMDHELEQYMQEEVAGKNKRKRPVKERLGAKAEMDFIGRYEVTDEDPEDKVIDEIAHRLKEPKKDLIERVVRTIGKKKALELLSETATIEKDGGLFTVDGSRRRTPGGVFLNLLKNTPSITNKQIKEIFHDENQKDYNNKKAAKKRRRHEVAKKMKQAINMLNMQEHDDVSRETFASDTNEALQSLEELPEEMHGGQAEPALGTEDTPVVYNSSDLEVF